MYSVAKMHSQTYSIDLTRVSVPAKDGSKQLATFTDSYIGPVLKYPIMPIKD
jgi:hypothetical protein